MRTPSFKFFVAFALLSGCASQTGPKSPESQEVLDEHTGVTVGALQAPLEFVEAPSASLGDEKRTSFAYLGPLDWDRSGDSTYGLWRMRTARTTAPGCEIDA